MSRPNVLIASLACVALACGSNTTEPLGVGGTYILVSENGQSLPSDPSAPYGCCLTLSGSLTLTVSAYDLRTFHRNKNNGLEFDNAEQGTYTREGNTLSFTRTGGGGEGFPYLLAPGVVSEDGDVVTIRYGDEGPGSDQTEATFRR